MALAPRGLNVVPLTGIPSIQAGNDLPALLAAAISRSDHTMTANDILVVAQKVVSKAEGAMVELGSVEPGAEALKLAEQVGKDSRLIELILASSVRVVRSVPGVLITETHHGLICANAGIDSSNAPGPDTVILLPEDPDRSAQQIREGIAARTGVSPAVVVSDTFNRPWRQGSTNVGIGTAGFVPLDDARGTPDDAGRILQATLVSIADEVAAAAQLVMGETGGVPAAIVSGLELDAAEVGSQSLLRDPERDLFR